MSTLQRALRDYVALRRSLGAKFQGPEGRLNHFVEVMAQRGTDVTLPPQAAEPGA